MSDSRDQYRARLVEIAESAANDVNLYEKSEYEAIVEAVAAAIFLDVVEEGMGRRMVWPVSDFLDHLMGWAEERGIIPEATHDHPR